MMKAERYVVSVRREARGKCPVDWITAMEALEGIRIIARGPHVQIAATPEAIERVREQIGSFCHVERFIEHRRA